MKLTKITAEEFIVSNWSGGKTTQIAIDPPQAAYADRSFNFRLSSATVELEESDFTPLPDYARIISPISGQLQLYFNDSTEPVVLEERKFCFFDGAWQTRSKGKVIDYNLMTRKGVCSGDAFALTLDPGESTVLPAVDMPDDKRFVRLLWCVEGAVRINVSDNSVHLAQCEAVRIEPEAGVETPVQAGSEQGIPAVLMIADVRFF